MKHSLYIRLILDFAEDFFHVPQGEFMNRAPLSPPPLPGVSETDWMTYFWLSEYMANTASYVYQKAVAFKHTLTPENVKVGPTGVCYREVLYCIGPTVWLYVQYVRMSMYSKCCTYVQCIQMDVWRGHLYVIADCTCTCQFRPNED